MRYNLDESKKPQRCMVSKLRLNAIDMLIKSLFNDK